MVLLCDSSYIILLYENSKCIHAPIEQLCAL